MSSDFEKCIEWKLMKDGTVECHCKRGNFSVSGRNKEQVEREARHYWIQYLRDGEYDQMLGL